MKKHTIAAYAFWILLAEGAGGAVGWLTREGVRIYTETIEKPPFSPPPIVFPVAWTLLYALMGVSAARIALAPGVQDRARRCAAMSLAAPTTSAARPATPSSVPTTRSASPSTAA